jgi:hypothetical protein
MKLKWVIGRKTNYVIAALWALSAVIDFIKGDWYIGILLTLLAIHSLDDALSGDEIPVLDVEIRKEAK